MWAETGNTWLRDEGNKEFASRTDPMQDPSEYAFGILSATAPFKKKNTVAYERYYRADDFIWPITKSLIKPVDRQMLIFILN